MPTRVTNRSLEAPTLGGSARSVARGAVRFEVAETVKHPVKEASDVVSLPGGRFLIVSDVSRRVGVVGADGTLARVTLPGLEKGNSQLEGVAYDPFRRHLFVAREESGEVLRYEWNGDTDVAPKLEKTFKVPQDGPSNKGVEGLAYLPGDLSVTGRPQLLSAREDKPRTLLMFDDGGSGKPKKIHLEDQVRSVCQDFSAIAVDPMTGNIFISSDDSSTVAQLELVRVGDRFVGRLIHSFPLRDEKARPLERIEGLAFDERGDLFVLTENNGALHQLKRR